MKGDTYNRQLLLKITYAHIFSGIFALIAICIGSIAAQECEYNHGNGRPACVAADMGRLWRNNWDPTRYWVCSTENTPAESVSCETGTGFYEPSQGCIDWNVWQWTFPCDPPSVGDESIVATSECEYDHGNGRPACIAEEVDRIWRNNWDPTRFWFCSAVNAVAEVMICETGTGFLESAQNCVDWADWEWTPPCNPPSV
jgi:hypothetical protein